MAKVLTYGEMEESTMDSMSMTKRMVLVYIYGLMGELMLETGLMGTKTDKVYTFCPMAESRKVCGLKEKDRSGVKKSLKKRRKKH